MSNEELELLILKSAESMQPQRSLAGEIGFSVGTVNYVLKALVDKGFIKAGNFVDSENKQKYSYLLTDEGIKEKIELTKKFIERQKHEYEALLCSELKWQWHRHSSRAFWKCSRF
ncbi:MAG: MarR family EPS-associated transcriptional regulator [Sulfurimonas sp.]|nr:MAG: MarR family EPS-associated transcriptional regulator [Sulfurimonas sp.]